MFGWTMSSSYILGGSLAELLRFAGVQHAFWKEVSYKVACLRESGSTKCCVFQYKGWLRTWPVKLLRNDGFRTVSRHVWIMFGSCSNRPSIATRVFTCFLCVCAADGIPLCFATPGWFPHCKCDCKCCWWMSCRWNCIVFCNFRIVPAM